MNRFFETLEKLTGKRSIEHKMSAIHSGRTPLDELVALALRSREALREKLKFARPKREDAAAARAREAKRKTAFEKAGEKARARGRGFISTSDMDINTILARPNLVGRNLGYIHSGMLDSNRKLIKKEVKKKIKEEKKLLKRSKIKETPSEILQRLEREIADLERRQ